MKGPPGFLLAVTALFGATDCSHSPSFAPAPAVQPVRNTLAVLGADVLARQPELPELKEFDAPVPAFTTLPNGLRLYVVQRPEAGVEALEWVVRRGSAVDPPALPGLASMTAAMLETGSAGKSQTQLAAQVEAMGAELRVGAAEDATVIGISAMPSRLEPMISLLADVVLRPNFADGEWKHLQGQREAELIAERAQPSVGASLAWNAAAYGEHPLGRPGDGTPTSVRAMTLAQLRTFYRSFSPNDSAIVAVGGASAPEVARLVSKAFGGWKAGRRTDNAAQVLTRSPLSGRRPRLVLVDFPGKPQSVLRVGQPAIPRASSDHLALDLLNAVLGGSFTSWLNQNLREQHGYSYGAASRFAFGAGPGPFIAVSQVKTDVTGAALREMMHELSRTVAAPLRAEDLKKGKALLAFELVQSLESSSSAATTLSQIFLYDLPVDEFRTFVPRLEALTSEDVQAAALRHLKPDEMTIVVAGDLKQIVPQLKAESALSLPPAQKRNASGELLKGG